MAFILFFAALRKKRISEGFEHRSLNSSLELRGFMGDYFERLPLVGGRGWQVLGGTRGQRHGRSKVGEHRGAGSPSELQHGGRGEHPTPWPCTCPLYRVGQKE